MYRSSAFLSTVCDVSVFMMFYSFAFVTFCVKSQVVFSVVARLNARCKFRRTIS